MLAALKKVPAADDSHATTSQGRSEQESSGQATVSRRTIRDLATRFCDTLLAWGVGLVVGFFWLLVRLGDAWADWREGRRGEKDFYVLLVLLLCLSAAPARAEPSQSRVLDQIAQVESANRYWVIGPAGEVTAYQMRPRYWWAYTDEPLSRASQDPRFGRTIAAKHLAQLRRELIAYGYQVTAYNLALAWHAGTPAMVRGRTTAAQRDHAQRVANLVGR